MEILILIILGIISACLTRSVAESKGLNTEAWTLAGFALGPLALLAAAGCGDKRLQRMIRLIAEKQGVDIPETEEISATQFTISREASEDELWTAMLNSIPSIYKSSASQKNSTISESSAYIRNHAGMTIFLFKNAGLLSDSKTVAWKGKKA